jgi:glycosyltransferase involved in cell wall biosynthesis
MPVDSKIEKLECAVYVNSRFSESAENVNDLVARFEMYADKLAYLTRNSRMLLLLIGSNTSVVNANPPLLVKQLGSSSRNPIGFAIKARRSLRLQAIKPSILIAGDMTFGFLSSFIISRTYLPKIPIQISIHGNQWNFESKNPKTLFQYCWRKYVQAICNNASSIRVVSPNLQRVVSSRLKIGEGNIFVSPIPIFPIPSFIDKRNYPLCIAIIGRLHNERSPLDSIRIILDAFSSMPPCPVLIIGDGPLLESAKELVETTVYATYFNFLGSLSKAEILQQWPLINLVISSAEEEGYGLTIREALLSGAVVLCRSNRTTLEFRDIYKDGIFLFEELQEASEELVRLYSNLAEIKLNSSAGEVQRDLDEAAILTLVSSWNVN